MTVFLDIRSASSRVRPPPAANCKLQEERFVHSSNLISSSACPPVPVSVPSWDPRKPPPSTTPAAPLRSRDCIGRRIQLSRPAALLQDPLATLPPPPCIRTRRAALYCAAQQVLVPQFTGPASASLACPSGGSRRQILLSCWLSSSGRVPRGPSWVCLSALLPRPMVQAQTPALEPSSPGDQGSRPHLLGPATQCPFRHPRCCCFSLPILALSPACPVVPPSELQAGGLVCCLALGLLLSHQGPLTI